VRSGRQEFLLDRPPEHPPDPVDVLVDRRPGPAGGDHRLADVLEGPGTEPGRIGTFRADDPDLAPLDAADVAREALRLLEPVESASARPD
jgi:hypothetical protein